MENISTLENSSSILSVTLHENNFTKDGTYYATVSRNTATFKNIAMKCNAKGKSDVSESGNFYIKFTPTALANEAIASLSVDKIVYADGSPEITEVTDLSTGKTDGTLTQGSPARITGSRLKIGGKGSGIFFAPVDSDEKISSDESTWVRIEDAAIFRNKPSELNFFVPSSIEPGNFRIIVRTAYLSEGKFRKNTVEAASGVLSVKSE